MKNIMEILAENGVTVPEDKVDAINKAVAANYKTIVEYDKKVTKVEQERDGLKEQLETANKTLKSFDGVDVADIKKKLEDYKKEAEDAKKSADEKLAARDLADAIKAEMEGVKFTSNAAKKSVMDEISAAKLSMRDGKVVGFSDLLSIIKERDPDAFVNEEQEEQEKGKARFTGAKGTSGGKKMSREEILKIKDAGERQEAIAANIELFTEKE